MSHLDYAPPRWAEDGMRVLVPIGLLPKAIRGDKPQTHGLWCNVVMAAGHHARIANEKYGVNQIVALDDVRVPKDDPHA